MFSAIVRRDHGHNASSEAWLSRKDMVERVADLPDEAVRCRCMIIFYVMHKFRYTVEHLASLD